MNRDDFAFIARLLKERSGLVVTAEKAYLLESRLLPVAAKRGLASVARARGGAAPRRRCHARARHRRGDDHQRILLLPRHQAVRSVPLHHSAAAAARPRRDPAAAHLERRLRRGPGALFPRHDPGRRGRAAGGLACHPDGERHLGRDGGARRGRQLQPVRGPARPAAAISACAISIPTASAGN